MKNHLYPTELDFDSEFKKPSSVFRDAPFWSWNARLDPEPLKEQMRIFKEMGMGGFHMHVRTGLQTPYLGDEFMDRVKLCVRQAEADGQKAYLYDEDRWPSGSAGGEVSKDPAMRARFLRFTSSRLPEIVANSAAIDPAGRSSAFGSDSVYSRKLLKCYDLKFDATGYLIEYHIADPDSPVADGWMRRYVFLDVDGGAGWYNYQSYISTLNPEAVRRFIAATHERYYQTVGEDFGSTVPSIFTDEPQFFMHAFKLAKDPSEDALLAFVEDIPDDYFRTYGEDFWAALPEVLYDRADRKYSLARYRYHDFIAERFARSFSDQVGKWCDEHNLMLTGHMMEEPTLESQTHSLGDAMRSYRSFGLPGIDMLCDGLEFSTAKQAQSASRQFGCNGVLCELDGVTGWDFDFAGHKRHGDWQAALGVTLRVPHLAWLSMEGEAKRDYPASISYQSPWYKKYPVIADHFARVGVAMTRGKAVCKVGVIHPIESYWLLYGPQELSAGVRDQAERNFRELIETLLFGTIDFDFIAESLLPIQYQSGNDGKFHVGEMAYDAVVVPPTITLRGSTLERLEEFAAKGGRVVFAGDVAGFCDVVPSDRAVRLASATKTIAFNRYSLLSELDDLRDLRLTRSDGYPAEKLIYQLRQDGDVKYLFVANTQCHCCTQGGVSVAIKGEYQLDYLDTADGSATRLKCEHENGWTKFKYDFYAHGHLLLKLTPGRADNGADLKLRRLTGHELENRIKVRLADVMPVTLDEPNVLLLDRPAFRRVEEAAFHPEEEVLRAGNIIRESFGLDAASGGNAQPYIDGAPPVLGDIELKYTIDCTVPVAGASLALEHAEDTAISLDGAVVPSAVDGWWTDQAIGKVKLPDLSPGRHEIVLRYGYRLHREPEACYLLGDFGVKLNGRHAVIVAPVRKLGWGDAAEAGLPFYGGNLTYHAEFELENDEEHLSFNLPANLDNNIDGHPDAQFAGFSGTLVEVKLDDRKPQTVAFAPYTAGLGRVAKGRHRLDIILYGSRRNAFGPPHLPFRTPWIGPGEWRRNGNDFDYTYSLVKFGVLREPRLLEE